MDEMDGMSKREPTDILGGAYRYLVEEHRLSGGRYEVHDLQAMSLLDHLEVILGFEQARIMNVHED